MELTQSESILFGLINSKEGMSVSKEEFMQFLLDDNNLTSVIHQAMDKYARVKWDEACNQVRESVRGNMIIENDFFINGINPEFKP